MKTKQQNKQEKQAGHSTLTPQPSTREELQSRSEQLSGNTNTNTQTETAEAPENETEAKGGRPQGPRPYVNFEERERNRQLPTDRVLAILHRWMPRQYELAEVVGKWIWISFPEQPAEQVRAELSQLGFHWNNTRKCWQHPCGQFKTEGSTEDPRQKYTSYFAADQVAA